MILLLEVFQIIECTCLGSYVNESILPKFDIVNTEVRVMFSKRRSPYVCQPNIVTTIRQDEA